MNRSDFLKKLGLGSIALAIGSKVEINNLPEDELYDKIINNIALKTYNPDELESIDKLFKTPSGLAITATQLVDVTINNLNENINLFISNNSFYQAHKIIQYAKEDLLWLLKNWDWSSHEYYQNKIYKGLGDCYLVEAKEKDLNPKSLAKVKEWFSKISHQHFYTEQIENSYKLFNIKTI